MTDIALVSDHTQEALGLLIGAYRGLPRLSGLISAIVNRTQELESSNWDVLNKRLLDYTDANGNPAHATGAQLDTIGRLIGRGRNGQSDAAYLTYVRAQIFLNKSRALRGDVATLLQLLDPALFLYTEFYPCVIVIEYPVLPSTAPAVLADIAQHAVTGGVRLFIIAQAQTNGFLLGNDTAGGQVDPNHGLSNEAEATGGYLAGIW